MEASHRYYVEQKEPNREYMPHGSSLKLKLQQHSDCSVVGGPRVPWGMLDMF